MKKIYKQLILVGMVCTLFSVTALGQVKKRKLPKFNKNKETNVFLKKQWWLGFKAGANLSSAVVTKDRKSVV